ncbi:MULTISPECIES: RnfABCDGE type electron transport complex subunit D [Trichocoleus]|uniref:RnfABCDGE type electron transport complex subunit D n=1 Tax=Trichocoleus desertorum GB2-A4 TaxID=2933944 RepID=A0ABV0JBF7_9CYAN|nr:RnfABCDGE type electron transport complex subunit D [Trichocoleus sp. FACHB-46]MBD1860893.1 RnfABCDGE type electron transport complex subunit D [Trichocoleus sp. FACHB-46]
MLLQDARDYQILFLSLFLILGLGTRDWTVRPEFIVVTIATCLTTQWVMSALQEWWQRRNSQRSLTSQTTQTEISTSSTPVKKQGRSLRSALITSLGLCLLLRADHASTMALASSLAVLSKFMFQVQGKHFFNPANFGIIAVLMLTQDAWVSPGQWGDEWWYGLLFLGAGGLVLQRVGRWDTSAAFLATYAGLEAYRNFWLGWTWDVYWHRLMSGSLLLFALFMITDPRSIPNARIGRLVWSVAIAAVTFMLRNQFFIPTAVFWALFALSPLTLLIDLIWSAPRFTWSRPAPESGEPLSPTAVEV